MHTTYICPDYITNFRCDGAKCNSRCCRDWEIRIDPATYEKYCNIEPQNLQHEICRRLVNEGDVYNVRLRDNGDCPFLQDDLLCMIQRTKGEDFLSDICYSYPCMTYCFNNIRWQTLVMSCPVAARELLSLTKPLGFTETMHTKERLGRYFDVAPRLLPYGDYWLELKQTGIRILQDNQYSLTYRLANILFFYERADELFYGKETHKLPKLFSTAPEKYTEPEVAVWGMWEEEPQSEEYVRLMMQLYHKLYDAPDNEKRLSDLCSIYRQSYNSFRRGILTTWNLALENYLVNEFFMRFYPFAYNDSLTVNARIFVTTWKIVEFGLLMLNVQQPIDLERLILGINRMTDRLDHSRKVTQAIQRTVKSLHLNTAQYARLLLGK